jgi:phosphosulfolactate phosphohydrolase-like enzyme
LKTHLKTHLKRWSSDGKRVWTLNTDTGALKQLGVNDICVAENFYRVVGPDGEADNRVELMFAAVDEEVRRIQNILLTLGKRGDISFEDFMAAGVTAALQRMRASQSRRLMEQQDLWWGEQQADGFSSPLANEDRCA